MLQLSGFFLKLGASCPCCYPDGMVISKKLIARELLPKAANLNLVGLEISKQGWGVEAVGASSAVCPTCFTRSRSRHSRYHRKLQDLPVQGSPVMLDLQVGRWRCGNGRCVRKIFTERAPKLAMPRPLLADQQNSRRWVYLQDGRHADVLDPIPYSEICTLHFQPVLISLA